MDRWGGIFEAIGKIERGSYVSPDEIRVADLREHGIREYVVGHEDDTLRGTMQVIFSWRFMPIAFVHNDTQCNLKD